MSDTPMNLQTIGVSPQFDSLRLQPASRPGPRSKALKDGPRTPPLGEPLQLWRARILTFVVFPEKS